MFQNVPECSMFLVLSTTIKYKSIYKRPQENVHIAGVVHQKPISNEQMKKLFDNVELGPAENTNPYRGLFSFTSVSSLADEDKRINAS